MTRPPIATNAEGAMAYLACSKNCLETLRQQLAKWQGAYYERLTSEKDKGQLRVESK